MKVVLHVTVMCLNFVHANGKPIPLHVLRRQPAAVHLGVFDRLTALIKASSRLAGQTYQPGRKGLFLAARHSEVVSFLRDLGVSGPDYFDSCGPLSEQLPHQPGGPGELTPYRDLSAARVVVSGTGAWDLGKHLGPDLLLPYLEPRVMQHFVPPVAPGPTFTHESRAEVLGLLRKWDELGLLCLVPGPLPESRLTRVFGAYKAPGLDRQIGDRRHMNNAEGRIPAGPSHFLPAGSLLTRLVCPRGCALYGSCVDRKDFYHQAKVTHERATSNAIGPVFVLRDMYGLKAASDFLAATDRAFAMAHPDSPGFRPSVALATSKLPVHGAFSSLFQGDHAGVEFAQAAHESLLLQAKVLPAPSEGRLLGKRPVACTSEWAGLIIDDLFAISCERPPSPVESSQGWASKSEALVRKAKQAYAQEGVKGSDAKDQFGRRTFVVAGAQVDASEATAADGHILVGLPASRRFALSYASLLVAESRHCSEELGSILTGSWVSALLFRRCLMCCIGALFGCGKKESSDGGGRLLRLPAAARLDLVMLSVLAPIIVSDVSAPISPTVGASDASLARGAVCTTRVPGAVALHLWQACDQKGSYTKLSDAAGSVLDASGIERDQAGVPAPERPLACTFDFLEVRCGGGWLTPLLKDDFCCGPVFDFRASRHFNLQDRDALEWILFLLQERRLLSLLLLPPVGSFASSFRPVLRSWSTPEGFEASNPRVASENRTLGAALAVMHVALRVGAFAVLVHPARSFASAHPLWTSFAGRGGVSDAVLPACTAFSPVGCAAVAVLTRSSKALLQGPAQFALRSLFAESLRALRPAAPPRQGLESLVLNDVMLSYPWQVQSSWSWRDRAHINVLEARAFLHALRLRAREGGDSRFVHALDSAVAKGALAKGRTTSRLLLPVVKSSGAVQAAYGLYPSIPFCPTRLNTSDAPTRGYELEAPCAHSVLEFLRGSDLYEACELACLSKPSANWLRLACLTFANKSGSPLSFLVRSLSLRPRDLLPQTSAPRPSLEPKHLGKDFDSSLGYPGEGPLVQPRDQRDRSRAQARQNYELGEGRPVLARTAANRARLLSSFDTWLSEHECSVQRLLSAKPLEPETIATWLVRYGHELFDAGRPYWTYSETVNAIAAKQPVLRRQLQGAWDLAFAWMAKEPMTHHVAMPAIALLSILTTCLLWGWVDEAAIFAMSWAGLLRIGEATAVTREDLIFPADVLYSQRYLLVRVQEPKTRLRAARHQAARVEPSDLIALISLAFFNLDKRSKIWPQSNQTLRRRFDLVLERVGLSPPRAGQRPLDLGSFRPGGATFLLQATDNSELVRRRGRWVSSKVMEIYIQEVTACTFFPSLPLTVRRQVMELAQAFPMTLTQATKWSKIGIPPSSWYKLFSFAG